ncbi:hypothetical protein FB446DRAFT_388912 [Lentinula raphanica]|nr:hypothetical protein FB446DRAFT_388912 [Lentinula raphanica]
MDTGRPWHADSDVWWGGEGHQTSPNQAVRVQGYAKYRTASAKKPDASFLFLSAPGRVSLLVKDYQLPRFNSFSSKFYSNIMLFHPFCQKQAFSFALLAFVIFELVFAVHSAAVPTEMHLAARTKVRALIDPGEPASRYTRVVPGSDLMGQRRSIGQELLPLIRDFLPLAYDWSLSYLPPSLYVTAADTYSFTFSASSSDESDDRLKNMGTGIITIIKKDPIRGYIRWRQYDKGSDSLVKKLDDKQEALKNLLKLYQPFLKEREDAAEKHKYVISYSALETTSLVTVSRPIIDRREWVTCIRDVIVASVKHLGFAQDLSNNQFVPINTAYLYQLKSSAGNPYCLLPFSVTLPESRALLHGTIDLRLRDEPSKKIVLKGTVEWKSKDKEPYELDMITIREIARLAQIKITPGVSYRVTYTTVAPGPGYQCFKDSWKPTTDFEGSAQAAIAKALGIEPYDAVSATGAKLNVYTKGSEYSIPFATAEAQVPEKQKSGHLLFRWGQKNSDGESGPVVEVVWDGSEGSTEVDVHQQKGTNIIMAL